MCGIAGFLNFAGFSPDHGIATVSAMADRVAHRGPDDSGSWVDGAAGIAFGHRRLSILDLSPAGHQPMLSASGRYVIVFNGECYNHMELRRDLESDATWHGHSDTETLLAGIEAWGLEGTLQRVVGMFAFALWDRKERTLTLARDRMGEKPLYYGWHGGTFLFGSELKALRAHPDFRGEIDRDVLTLFLRHGYIPPPHSIYQKTRKLVPGSYVRVPGYRDQGVFPEETLYWSLRGAVEAGLRDPFRGSETDAADELESRLAKAVSLQRIADVPLGAFLSGGIDSSTVVALMQAQSGTPVKTFTIGFHETRFNEAVHAKKVAAHLGTDHTELYITSREALDVIPRLPSLYDEPFGDASAVPTHLVSQLARRHVTVSLSGDGGDELFFGYGRYFRALEVLRDAGRIPRPLRAALPFVLRAAGLAAGAAAAALPRSAWPAMMERKALRASEILGNGSTALVYRCLVSHWIDPTRLVPGSREPMTPFTTPDFCPPEVGIERTLMYLDYASILPEDILAKVDRAAMGVSLETRVPFLDHRVVELAQSLPLSFLHHNGSGKAIVRRVLARYVPPTLFERPKKGFGVPIGEWMRGPLRPWAEDLLSPARVREEGFFDDRLLTRTWNEYLRGGATWENLIWDVLMFQAWRRSLDACALSREVVT